MPQMIGGAEVKARDWLLGFRDKLGFTQEAVASQAGIDRSYYTQLELGVRTPSVTVAKSVAGVLGFNWTLFFEDNVAFCDNELNQKKIH